MNQDARSTDPKPERRPPFGLPERGPLAGRWARLESSGRATRVRAAWVIAIAADVLQVALFPAFASGFLSPANDTLDVVVAVLLWRLLGWHLAFLPTFVAELVPGLSLIPTWTAAVWLATRGAPRGGGAKPPPTT